MAKTKTKAKSKKVVVRKDQWGGFSHFQLIVIFSVFIVFAIFYMMR